MKGTRYDLSRRNGLLSAQIALGLAGKAHDETLTTIVELLAEANARKLTLSITAFKESYQAHECFYRNNNVNGHG